MSAPTEVPTEWAGGSLVCVPGLGVGRIVLEQPRVIEIDLPAPECAIFEARGPDGPRVIVLADPRTPYETTLRAIAAARMLEASSAAGALTGAVPTPRGSDGTTLLEEAGRPGLQLIRGGRLDDDTRTGDACC